MQHILFVIVPRWGHLRPAISFASKLIKEASNLTITFPVPLSLQQDVLKHVEQHFEDDKARIRLRIIAIGPAVHRDQNYRTFISEFESFYSTMISNTPYVNASGEVLLPIPGPKSCMMDYIFRDIMQIIRRITNDVLIFALSFGCTSFILRVLMRGDVPAQAERLSQETGKPIDELIVEFYQPNKGTIITIPGLLPMYDYEIVPQLSSVILRLLTKLGPRSYEFLRDCDGIIASSPRIYEPESTAALENYLAETGRPLYVIGPLGLTEAEVEKEPASDKNAVVDFLNGSLERCGQKSLVYISFGSVFWPPNLAASWKIMEMLALSNKPVLISHDDQRAVMPESLRSTLISSENVLLTSWAPQNLVLGHEVTGWFLTHCGQNSVMEALYNGVPMIAWPIDTDQPLNAAYLSLKLNLAYELIEVRTEKGLKPLHRGITPRGSIEALEEEFQNVMKSAWGPDGEQKRRNAEELGQRLRGLWEESGESRKELRRLLLEQF